jgi:hypothetical protein
MMSIAILVLDGGARSGGVEFPEELQEISDLLDRVYGDVNPLMRQASSIADNVNYITTSVRPTCSSARDDRGRRTSDCSRRWRSRSSG